MEPNTIIPPTQSNTNPTPDPNSTLAGLRDEGIDIVQGSGVSEENEFSAGESVSAELPVLEQVRVEQAVPKPPVPQNPVPKKPADEYNLTRASAAMIGSLQEIPKSFTAPKPAVEPVPSKPPVATPSAAVNSTPKPVQPFNDPSIKQIRTFKSDAEEAVKYQKVSAVDIAIAEQKKRERQTPIEYEAPKSHAGIFILSVLAIVVLLGGGWYYWFSSSQGSTEIKKAPAIAIKTIIPYTKGSTITLDPESDPLLLIGAKLEQSNAGLGNVFALIPVASTTAKTQIDISSVLRNTSIPNRFLRSLGEQYMIGTYTYEVQSPFMILSNTFFQNAFSGMLEWEKSMSEDFLPLIQVSHPAEISYGTVNGAFEDALMSNVDVRVLRNNEGKIILLYTFADKDTLIITTTETALKFILDRLLTVRTIQ